jgi:hypothetical protein
MTPFFLTIVLLVGALVLGEFALWRMFRRRIDPVTFPSDVDASSIGFYKPGRMRAIALLHTLALGACIVFFVAWLW